MIERRGTKRVPLRRAAWIMGAGGEKIACVLANLSESGAQLELLGCDLLPQQFTLCLEDKRCCARLVWRRRWRFAVTFEDALSRLAA
jgi:transposase